MLIQPFPEPGATNKGQRVDAGQGSGGATIPERTDQQAGRRRRGHRGGRPPAFDPNTYRRRGVVERCINRLKQWRGIVTRLVIATGKKKGQHPSPATVMRMLREHDEKTAAAIAAG